MMDIDAMLKEIEAMDPVEVVAAIRRALEESHIPYTTGEGSIRYGHLDMTATLLRAEDLDLARVFDAENDPIAA